MLGFLNTVILFGLIGVGLPVLIHLFARQKIRKILFSTTAFIKQVHTYRLKRIRLRQILLLILRCLAILFLVMGFARPTIRSHSISGNGAGSNSIVLIMDRSLSTMRQGLPGQESEWVKNILEFMKNGDEVAVIQTVNPHEGEFGFTHDPQIALRRIESQPSSFAKGKMEKSLNAASALLARSRNLNKEIYLISDLQASEFVTRPDSAFYKKWNFSLFILPIKGELNNLAVGQMGIENQIIQPQTPVRIFAEIANYGNHKIHDLLVRAFIEDQVTAQKVIDLKPGEKQRIVFPIKIAQTGWVRCRIQIDEDDFPQDNEGFLVFRVPETIRVLILGKDRESTRPLELAISPQRENSGIFKIEQAFYGERWIDKVSRADVILISNYPSFQSEESQRLKQFIESGGGIFLVPGNNSDISNYNRFCLKPWAGIEFGAEIGKSTGSQGYFPLRSLDSSHPVFEGVFQSETAKFQPLRFYRVLELIGKIPESVLTLQDKICLLGEIPVGKGELFLFTSSIDPEWSDVAYSSLFAPLIYRSVLYLSQGTEGSKTILSGETITVSIDTGNVASKYCVEIPDGSEIKILPEMKRDQFVLGFSSTTLPGFYRFYEDKNLIGIRTVNIDPAESDFRVIDEKTLHSYFEHIDFRIVHKNDQLEEIISAVRWGRELWKEMLIFGLMVLIIEMLIMRENRFQDNSTKRMS